MIASLDDIRTPIDLTLRSIGFRSKSKRLWDREVGRIVQVVHLDRSSYGPQNRLEVFFSLKEFIDLSKYKLGDFDIRVNFNRIADNPTDFKSALDQDNASMPPDIRAEIIRTTLKQSLEPLLRQAVDEQGLSALRKAMPSNNDLFMAPRTAAALSARKTDAP